MVIVIWLLGEVVVTGVKDESRLVFSIVEDGMSKRHFEREDSALYLHSQSQASVYTTSSAHDQLPKVTSPRGGCLSKRVRIPGSKATPPRIRPFYKQQAFPRHSTSPRSASQPSCLRVHKCSLGSSPIIPSPLTEDSLCRSANGGWP